MKLIDEERLADLLKAEVRLKALEAYDVDEWEPYMDALDDEENENGMSYWDYESQPTSEITKDFKTV